MSKRKSKMNTIKVDPRYYIWDKPRRKKNNNKGKASRKRKKLDVSNMSIKDLYLNKYYVAAMERSKSPRRIPTSFENLCYLGLCFLAVNYDAEWLKAKRQNEVINGLKYFKKAVDKFTGCDNRDFREYNRIRQLISKAKTFLRTCEDRERLIIDELYEAIRTVKD